MSVFTPEQWLEFITHFEQWHHPEVIVVGGLILIIGSVFAIGHIILLYKIVKLLSLRKSDKNS